MSFVKSIFLTSVYRLTYQDPWRSLFSISISLVEKIGFVEENYLLSNRERHINSGMRVFARATRWSTFSSPRLFDCTFINRRCGNQTKHRPHGLGYGSQNLFYETASVAHRPWVQHPAPVSSHTLRFMVCHNNFSNIGMCLRRKYTAGQKYFSANNTYI